MSTTPSARRKSIRAAAAVLLLAAGTRADVLHVPADFATIADALAAAQTGDEIVLASGTYSETVVLDGLQGVVLRGQGQAVLTGGSAVDAALTVDNCTNVTVENLRLANALGRGVFALDSSNVTLRRLHVEGGSADGILGGEISGLLVDRCRVAGVDGVGIETTIAVNCTISRCTVEDCSGTGIVVSDTDVAKVERCRVVHAGLLGLNLGQNDPVQHATARRNVVIAAGSSALRINGTDCVSEDNRLTGSGGGLEVDGVSDGVVSERDRVIGGNFGVLVDSANVLLRDARVLHVDGLGVEIQSGPVVVQGVRVVSAGAAGFSFQGTDGGTALGCRAAHAGDDGFAVDGDGMQFIGNTSAAAGLAGFHVTGNDNVFTDNVAHGSGDAPAIDTGTGNIYLGNQFEL